MTPGAPVLVADDQAALRRAFVRALQRDGFETLEAATGPDVLGILAETTLSAVVLDHHMPGVTGLELIEAIRRDDTTSDLPVILATGSSTQDDLEAARRLGANEILMKPVDLAEFVSTVHGVVGAVRP